MSRLTRRQKLALQIVEGAVVLGVAAWVLVPQVEDARHSLSTIGIAQLVWLVCVLAALVLAIGALLVALKANKDNDLVTWVLDAADKLDLTVFDRSNGIKDFTGKNAEIKEALLNWGLAAIVWLVAGRIIDRIIRP